MVPLSPPTRSITRLGSNASDPVDAPGLDDSRTSTPFQLQYLLLRESAAMTKNRFESLDGHYSISKLDAFATFQSSTSIAQATMVLLATPLPSVTIMLLLECIPLADPSLGWQANHAYLLRTLAGTFVTAITLACVIQEYIPESKLSWRQMVFIGGWQASIYVGTTIALAEATDMFPVPFAMIICIVSMVAAGACLNYIIARPQIAFIPDFGTRYRHILEGIQLESLYLVVYPMYTTAFMQLSSQGQLCFSLLLPVFKFCFRVFLWKKTQNEMDVFGTVTGLGHFFHALFTVTCIQNSKTIATMWVVLAWNIAQALRCSIDMVRSSRKIVQRQGESTPEAARTRKWCDDVVKRVLGLLEQKKVVSLIFHRDASVLLSSYHRYYSPKWIAKHQELLGKQQRSRACFSDVGGFRQAREVSERPRRFSTAMRSFVPVGPRVTSQWLHLSPRVAASRNASVEGEAQVQEIQDVIAAFHKNEAALLRSYISGFVYVLYGELLARSRNQRRSSFSFPHRFVVSWYVAA